MLAETRHLAPLLNDKGYRPIGAVSGAPAASQRLRQFCGDVWMAVGDAAQAYDPLSSQGIEKALATGSHAGHMIHYALSDCSPGARRLDASNQYVRQYDDEQSQLWEKYLSQRDFYYHMQPRWPEQLFWRRRNTARNR